MPLIKKTLGVVFAVLAAITIAQRMGIDVKAFIAGLGIGGLAFALAAQDTLSNFFGSLVVAVTGRFAWRVRPHRVRGRTVEDIGLRSTKLRTGARTRSSSPTRWWRTKLSRTCRGCRSAGDQTIGLTYHTTPVQMQALLEDIRGLLRADPRCTAADRGEFHRLQRVVADIGIVYFAANPDWQKHWICGNASI